MAEESKKNRVLIDLSDSTYAHGFAEQNRIHQSEFDLAVRLIENQIQRICNDKRSEKFGPNRVHNTISVFGDRGTGKTSFIKSLFDEIDKRHSGKKNEIKILGLIDPTLMEEKVHIFLLLISMINDEVKAVIEKGTCEPGGKAYKQRMDWEACVKKLAKGLPSLDKVGKDYNNTSWQDDEFIMQKGLDDIMAAYKLEENFHKMVDMALNILEKKAFVVAFDDIDINMEKGWRVLETIRKYITTPKVITLLSGNMYLYNLNVRGQQWDQFGGRLLSHEKERDYYTLVNQLENQYMLKVFKADNRIHLNPISYYMRLHDTEYTVKGVFKTSETKISEAYKDVLDRFGISGDGSQKLFVNYMMGLSIRSQINFLKLNWDSVRDSFSISNIEAFLSRMYAAGIEVQLAYANPNLLNIVILTYLTKGNDNSLRNTYLLMPTTERPEDNACLTGLSTVFASLTATYPGLLFDYMIRIGYLRNLILSIPNQAGYKDFIDFASFKHDVSLKNIIATSMAYKLSDDHSGETMKEHKPIYGLSGRAKKKGVGKIDNVLNDAGATQKVLGYMPLCALQYDAKNESRLFYSFYILLGCIGTVLRNIPDSSKASEEEIRKVQESIKDILKDMAQLRSYAVPDKMSGSKSPQDETENSNDVVIIDDEGFSEFAEKIRNWINTFYAMKLSVPAYIVGRIVTRFHRTAMKIEAEDLGDYMHRIVVAFINACLIEECKEYLLSKHKDASLTKLNFNNAVTSDKVLIDNLSNLSSQYQDTLVLTGWLVESPFFWPYLNKELVEKTEWKKLTDCYDLNFGVYEILKKIGTKDIRNPFFYARDTYMLSYRTLLEGNFDLQKLDVAEVNQDLIDELKDYFSMYVSKRSVEGFIDKVKKARLLPFSISDSPQESLEPHASEANESESQQEEANLADA